MFVTKRKREPRRSRQQLAWIVFEDDFVNHECQVLDVSLNGAKIVTDIDAGIGSRFKLSAVPNALMRQQCEVVWRRGRTVGIKFVR